MAKRKIVKKAVKKKSPAKMAASSCCACNWSGKDTLWTLISELGLYFFFYYGLYLLGVQANLWFGSLALLVLLNISWFTCPIVRKHHKC